MLKEYMRICDKYQLRYYLVGGSCLGAVRHRGFIPWDDDIDVGMPRKDYETFLKVAVDELCRPYFLQTHITEPDYPLNFAKIRNNETTFVESSIAHLNINHGVYLDIFPMDGYSPSRLLQFRLKRFKWGVERAFVLKEWRSLGKKICVRLCTLTLRDYRKARDRMNDAVMKYDNDQYDTVISHFGAWGKKEIFDKNIFGQGSVGMFEGMEVMLPADPDAYCRQLYGNYMQYPPVEARVTHHHCDVIDLDKPYTYYQNKGNY
jgi:lipopolysaccharide cholinephosphotransferase